MSSSSFLSLFPACSSPPLAHLHQPTSTLTQYLTHLHYASVHLPFRLLVSSRFLFFLGLFFPSSSLTGLHFLDHLLPSTSRRQHLLPLQSSPSPLITYQLFITTQTSVIPILYADLYLYSTCSLLSFPPSFSFLSGSPFIYYHTSKLSLSYFSLYRLTTNPLARVRSPALSCSSLTFGSVPLRMVPTFLTYLPSFSLLRICPPSSSSHRPTFPDSSSLGSP